MTTMQANTRVQVKNILFATDFSAAAWAAAPYAAALARHYGAKIYALHVRPPVVNPATPPEFWKSAEQAAEIVARQHEGQLRSTFSGMPAKVLMNDGDLWSNFASTIQKFQIDLLVMGTRGRTGIDKFLLGSVAEEVFRQVSCPVLTVGPIAASNLRSEGEFTRILFATDSSPKGDAAAPFAISLAQEYEADLTLLHVINEPRVGDLVGPAELTSSLQNRLRSLVPPEASSWCKPDYVVENGKAADVILQVADSRRANLIVLGIKAPTGVPGAAEHLSISIAHEIVSHAKCPVLTVRS